MMNEILKSSGYRYLNKCWAKPVGFSVLTIEIKENNILITCWFKSNNEIFIWNSEELKIDNDLAYNIRYFESKSRFNIGDQDSDFSFLTLSDY